MLWSKLFFKNLFQFSVFLSSVWQKFQIYLIIKMMKRSTLCQVSHLMAFLVLNQDLWAGVRVLRGLEGLGFEDVWSFRGLVGLKYANSLKHMGTPNANNASNLLARQPFSLCRTYLRTVVAIIILHLPFSLPCAERKHLFENDKDETSCFLSGGSRMCISREIPLVR